MSLLDEQDHHCLLTTEGWLEKAFAASSARAMELMALEDPDLEVLWARIGGL